VISGAIASRCERSPDGDVNCPANCSDEVWWRCDGRKRCEACAGERDRWGLRTEVDAQMFKGLLHGDWVSDGEGSDRCRLRTTYQMQDQIAPFRSR